DLRSVPGCSREQQTAGHYVLSWTVLPAGDHFHCGHWSSMELDLKPAVWHPNKISPRSRSSQCPFVPRRLALCTPDPGRGLCVENGGLPHDSFPRGTAEYSSRLL